MHQATKNFISLLDQTVLVTVLFAPEATWESCMHTDEHSFCVEPVIKDCMIHLISTKYLVYVEEYGHNNDILSVYVPVSLCN
jgi:hypothetical protein